MDQKHNLRSGNQSKYTDQKGEPTPEEAKWVRQALNELKHEEKMN